MPPQGAARPPLAPSLPVAPPPDGRTAARAFLEVLDRVEPVAEAACRQQRPDLNCDFLILVDNDASKAPNAFQTLEPQTGRPVIGFTLSLIAEARSADELAFVLGHEAGHHIAGHLPRQKQSAAAGAVLLGVIAALGGADAAVVENASQIGASVGARRYSQDYELEADSLGTLIAWRAGYNPEAGAAFFSRLPDPGNSFLGSHPPNAARMQRVTATLEAIRSGRLR